MDFIEGDFRKLKKENLLIAVLCSIIFLSSCTYTPWHKEQSEIFLNKGISFIEMGQFHNALKDLLEAEKYSSGDHRIHYYLGIAYLGKGMRERAEKEFKIAVSLKEDYSEAHNYLGTLYLDMELWDKAIEEFDKALDNPIYDTPVMPLFNSGWAYYNKKDYSAALARYRQALRTDPGTTLRPQIEKNIGLVFYDQMKTVDAIYHFKKSIDLNPSLYDAHFLLAECYLRIKDYDNAKKSLQTVIKLSPDSSFGQRAKNYLKSLK
jgi:type IV pilus assembly protein PilF